MKKIALIAFLFSQSSFSMISESYLRANQIHLAVTEMATNLIEQQYTDINDIPISEIKFVEDGIIVGIRNDFCKIKIATIPLPIGAVGVPGYKAIGDLNNCGIGRKQYKVIKYEKIHKAILEAAAKNQPTVEVQITEAGDLNLLQK